MKQLVKATIMFIASLSLFTAVVYAWFTNSNESNIQPVNASMIERNIDMDIDFGINGGGYQNFDQPADINAFLSTMQAGDQINIRVTIQNSNTIATPDMLLNIMLFNIRASESDIAYDLMDFFYIVDGTMNLSWYYNLEDYHAKNHYQTQSILLAQIDETLIEYVGVSLESYRLSNVLNHYMDGDNLVIENNITILETAIASQQIIVVEFSIGLDGYTPSFGTGIQNGELLIDGIYTLFEQ